MIVYRHKINVPFLPEWDVEVEKLQKEKFPQGTKAELFRYLIQLGLHAAREDKTKPQNSP